MWKNFYQIEQTLWIYAPHNYFRIITITFPNILIQKSLDTAIAIQTNQIALLQQEVNIIKADTEKMISQIKSSTTKINNYALTNSNQINRINKIFGMIDNSNNITLFNTQNNVIVNV